MNDETYKTRYFNKINYDKDFDSLIKSSTKVDKIKAEYDYYYKLPDTIKPYFVRPYNYSINNGVAQYCVEKVDAQDAAKQFISNTKSHGWYDLLMERVTRFLNEAPSSAISSGAMAVEARELVIGKSIKRAELLESDPRWLSSKYRLDLENLGITTKSLINRLDKAFTYFYQDRSTVNRTLSHGDLCLSNILWDESSNIFKLIDPKGIESMYLDEYYDIAKLCHSIVGNYDDIVYENYELDYENKKLKITRSEDEYYWNTFRQWVIGRDLSFELVRVYEVSIFISMLINHLDDDKRVAAFMLNANWHLESLGFGINSIGAY